MLIPSHKWKGWKKKKKKHTHICEHTLSVNADTGSHTADAINWLAMAGRHPQAQKHADKKDNLDRQGQEPPPLGQHAHKKKMQALREILHTSIINWDLNQNG